MYAGIESIGGMVGVSSPPGDPGDQAPADRTEEEMTEMFERIKLMLGGDRAGNDA